jgi:hypothetical protein
LRLEQDEYAQCDTPQYHDFKLTFVGLPEGDFEGLGSFEKVLNDQPCPKLENKRRQEYAHFNIMIEHTFVGRA